MAKFNYLQDMAVKADDTAELTIYSIVLPNGKNPILIGRHSGETNKSYANAILKGSVKQSKMVKAGMMTVGMIEQNRDQDRELFPIHVLTGWKDVCDGDRNEVPFSKAEAAEFIQALPNDIFDEVRDFFGSPTNFRQTVDPDDATNKGKK